MVEIHYQVEEFRIAQGGVYIYTQPEPKYRNGQLYKVLHIDVYDESTHYSKVLIKGLTGKDKGRWSTLSPQNFAFRYQLVEPQPGAAADGGGVSKV